MNSNDGEDFKILIDALKYTSNIIVNITNKLSEQDEKIERLENNLNKLYKIYNNDVSIKNNKELDVQIEKIKDNDTDMASFIVEKTKNKTDVKNNNYGVNRENNFEKKIPKDRNKIDKLINSIVKRKKTLTDIIENNKEKSLLTDYNTVNNRCEDEYDGSECGDDKEIIKNTNSGNNADINFSIKTSKTDYSNTQSGLVKEEETNKTGNTDILKTIRRRSNFAKRL
jgi:hypothetical protein